MPFQKITKAMLRPPEHIRISHWTLTLSADGWNFLKSLHFNLINQKSVKVSVYYDADTCTYALAPGDNDPDAVHIQDGKLNLKPYLGLYHVGLPIKSYTKTFEQTEIDGQKAVAFQVAGTVRSGVSIEAPTRKGPWKPRDPVPTRGPLSISQAAFLETPEGKAALKVQLGDPPYPNKFSRFLEEPNNTK